MNSLYYYGASVTANQKVVQASSKVYGINANGDTVLRTENPTVIGSTTTDQDNRIVLSGSSLMFSDESINEGVSWLDTNDNKKLWNNIIQWLTFSEQIEKVNRDIPESVYLILGSFTASTLVLLPIGWYFYRKGAIEEKAKVKQVIKKDQEEEEDKELTKREMRLRQRLRSKK